MKARLAAVMFITAAGQIFSFSIPCSPFLSVSLRLCTTTNTNQPLRSSSLPAPRHVHRQAVRCSAAESASGPVGGFNTRDFVALQLIGADVGRKQPRQSAGDNPDDCPTIFLGPTLQLDEGGNVNLKSRLDVSDGTTASGMRRAVPIPITSQIECELLACLRGYEALDPKRVPGRQLSLLERGQAFIKTQCLHDKLPLSADQRRAATQRILQLPNKLFPKTPLDVALAVWTEAKCSVQMVVLDEVESLDLDDSVALGAHLAYSDGAPVYLRREIYEETVCRVLSLNTDDPESEGVVRTGMRVDVSQAASWRLPQNPRQLIARAEAGLARMQAAADVSNKLWELKAQEVLTLDAGRLRILLRQQGVPTRRRQGREEMIDKVLPMMDEKERRVVLIRRAVEEEDYRAAAALAAGTSRRGRLADELVEAVRQERYEDASSIQLELEAATMGRADITQEAGAYDPFLDADDWYIKDIIKSRRRLMGD